MAKPQIGIIIPLRAPETTSNWAAVSANCRRTLNSVFQSTSSNYQVALVCHQPPADLKQNERLHVVKVKLPVPDTHDGYKQDKGRKIAEGARRRLRFKLVGTCGVKELYEVFEQIPGLQIELVDAVDWSDLSAVSQAISDFDVGLYSLLPNEFNHYKCGFKALEYMAMRIPVVASPVANNADVVQHGETGLLVHTADEWVASLEELIQDGQKRLIMGQKGRERVEVEFCVMKSAHIIADVISSPRR